MITEYNRTSTQLLAIEEKKTRPLPSCTPPTSAGHVPTLSSSQTQLQVPANSSQDGQVPGMLRRGSGVKNDPTYEDYLMMVKEVQMLKVRDESLCSLFAEPGTDNPAERRWRTDNWPKRTRHSRAGMRAS